MILRSLYEHVKRLSPAKRSAVWFLCGLLILTWLAACLVLASYWLQKAS